MGKKTKAHRAKVAKRNKRIAQERYSAQKAMQKMLESVRNGENMDVKLGDKQQEFEILDNVEKQLEENQVKETPMISEISYNPENQFDLLAKNVSSEKKDGFEPQIDSDISRKSIEVKGSND